HTLEFPGGVHCAQGLLGRCCDVRPAAWREAATGCGPAPRAQAWRQCQRPRPLSHDVLSAGKAVDSILRLLAQERDLADTAALCRLDWPVPTGAAAVLSGLGSSGTDGRSEVGRRGFAQGH